MLGREFTHGIWQALGGTAVLAALPVLLQARLLRETETGYSFQHDLTRAHVYQTIAPAQRILLHRRVGMGLEQQHGDALTQAHHFEQGEAWAAAVRTYRLAGERAARAYLYLVALNAFDQAFELLRRADDLPPDEQLALLCARQRVLLTLGHLARCRADLDAIEPLAQQLGAEAALLAALETRVALLSLDSQNDAMHVTATRGLTLARQLGDRSAEARIGRSYAFQLIMVSAAPPAQAFTILTQSVSLAEAAHDEAALVSALCTLAFAERLHGRSADAHSHAARALALAETRADLYPARAEALRILAEVAFNRAEWEVARATMQTAIRLLEELNDLWPLAITCFMAGANAYLMGQHDEARALVEKLRDLVRFGQIAPDSHWAMYVHVIAIDTAVQRGDLAEADRVAHEARALIEHVKDVQASAYLLNAIGTLRLFQNRPREARTLLEQAIERWHITPSSMIAPFLMHATSTALLGDRAAAERSLGVAEHECAQRELPIYDVPRAFTRFLVRGAPRDLQTAHDEMQRQAGQFRDERLRADFLQQVRMHRTITHLWRVRALAPALRSAAALWVQFNGAHEGDPAVPNAATRVITVRLARADTTPSKSLRADERSVVQWTLEAPDDAHIYDKAARRQHRLKRLLDEAAAQEAAPTDDDLARVLNVSRRTILRDRADLARAGVLSPTRRRPSD